MNQRKSITAIAIAISARAAPNQPGSPGAAIRLMAEAASAAATTAHARSGRSRHPTRRSPTEIGDISLFLHEARLGGADPPLQLGAHLLGDAHRVHAVPNDLRPDEDEQFCALPGPVGVAEQIAERELVDDRKPGALFVVPLTD